MRAGISVILILTVLCSCDQNTVYQEFVDMDERVWLATHDPVFTFAINDTTSNYDVYCNLRNSTHYPWSRVFVNFTLSDTLGNAVETKLVSGFLFEPKSGKPLGKSGLGDLYDHRIPVLQKYRFPRGGVYKVQLEQFMRTDSLAGILSVGLAIEKSTD